MEDPEIRDSRIEETSEAEALAVAYDRDATCFGAAASVATRAFLRANLGSMKEREVYEGRGRR
jgi:hypothetical protein